MLMRVIDEVSDQIKSKSLMVIIEFLNVLVPFGLNASSMSRMSCGKGKRIYQEL
jgi:hypothetical protein